jgi:hypothetical protein
MCAQIFAIASGVSGRAIAFGFGSSVPFTAARLGHSGGSVARNRTSAYCTLDALRSSANRFGQNETPNGRFSDGSRAKV